jgi:multidrug efflux pump subunit AcrA (membrane-fusion protein)
LSSTAFAGAKSYQVTGPVLDVSADSITVQKGKESWQIAKGADTKMSGDVKKGAVVVPSVAIQRGTQGAFVYVVKEDQTAAARPQPRSGYRRRRPRLA